MAPTLTPAACGSDLAIQDVLDAVEDVLANQDCHADTDRIYVAGVSGGGHMALLLAARHPHRWAGVSAWASIADLQAWWKERSAQSDEPAYLQRYAKQVEAVAGGKPDGSQPKAVNECGRRSPLTFLSPELAGKVALDINAGIHDGRSGSVPFSHSLSAFAALLPPSKQLAKSWISKFYQSQLCPDSERFSGADPLYEGRKLHYRSTHESSRVTIFEGGHEILHGAALNWLSHQRRGKEAIWYIPTEAIDWTSTRIGQSESGR